jgi:hypothetical protein
MHVYQSSVRLNQDRSLPVDRGNDRQLTPHTRTNQVGWGPPKSLLLPYPHSRTIDPLFSVYREGINGSNTAAPSTGEKTGEPPRRGLPYRSPRRRRQSHGWSRRRWRREGRSEPLASTGTLVEGMGGASVPKKKGVAVMLRGKAEGGGGPVEDELRGGRCGKAVAGAPPATGGGGRRFGRWWMRGRSWSLVRRW